MQAQLNIVYKREPELSISHLALLACEHRDLEKLKASLGSDIQPTQSNGYHYWAIPLHRIHDVVINVTNVAMSPGVMAYLQSLKNVPTEDDTPFVIQGMKPERVHEIHPFQWQDMRWWIAQGGRGCWFWDMRLGKCTCTVLMLRWLMENVENLPLSLIVTPNNGKWVYKTEEEDWLQPPHDMITVLTGSTREKRQQLQQVNKGGVVLNWDSLRLLEDDLLGRVWGLVVLDESHNAKNPYAKRSQVAQKLRGKCMFRLPLTGTPQPNNPTELWGSLNFVNPYFYPNYRTFVDRFTVPDLGNMPRRSKAKRIVAYKQTHEIMAALDILTRRRIFEEEMAYKPNVLYSIQPITMGTEQQQLYDSILEETIREYRASLKKNPMTKVIRCRQVASHPCLIGYEDVPSAKLEYFPWLLQNVDVPVVAFSTFPETVRRLAEELGEDAVLVTSDMKEPDREELRKEFQAGRGRVFCTTIGISKEAIKLDRADVTVFIDKTWVPSDMMQAVRRTWGQRKERPMSVISLVCHDTIEDYVEKRLGDKQLLHDIFIDRNWGQLDKEAAASLRGVLHQYLAGDALSDNR